MISAEQVLVLGMYLEIAVIPKPDGMDYECQMNRQISWTEKLLVSGLSICWWFCMLRGHSSTCRWLSRCDPRLGRRGPDHLTQHGKTLFGSRGSGSTVLIRRGPQEFVNALCPEIWNVEAGRLTQKGKTAVVEDAFADGKSRPGSKKASAVPTPVASASATPAGSGDEKAGTALGGALSAIKKKKLTRNQLKAKEERRKARKLQWLSFGGEWPFFFPHPLRTP